MSGSDAGNYKCSGSTATATITKKPLRVTGTPHVVTRCYDGTTDAEIELDGYVTLSGVLTGIGDSVILNATGAFTDATAGENKEVTVKYSITGTSVGNYSLSTTTTTTTGTITDSTITVNFIAVAYSSGN